MKAVNLVPKDQRRASRGESTGSGKGAYALLGLLGVLLLLAVGYVMVGNTTTEHKNAAAAAKAEAVQLEAQSEQKASYVDFSDIAATRLTSVMGVAQTRFDWERLMRELALVMPEGSWLQAADASVLGDVGATGAPAPTVTTSAGPPGPVALLTGCTPRQSDVARTMVRMRQLHRVEDVELVQSVREPDGTAASVESCGMHYKFDVKVTFSALTPAADTPRSANRVPVSLGGGS